MGFTSYSINGKVSLEWKKTNKKVTIDIIIPSNTKATFIYNDSNVELEFGNHHFEFEE